MFNKIFGNRPEGQEQAEAAAAGSGEAQAPAVDRSAEVAAALAADEARLAEAVAAGNEEALAGLALEGASTKLRQRAAEAINDPVRIRELIRAARGGRDNAVYRILTAKRDERLAAERAAEKHQADMDSLALVISRHPHVPYDPLYEATITEHERRWKAFEADAAPEVREAVARDLDAARAVLARHRAEAEAAEQARVAAEAAAVAEQAAREHLADEERTARAEQDAARAAADAADAERLAAEATERAAREKALAGAARVLIVHLRQVQAALAQGGSARADRQRKALAAKLAETPTEALPPWFARQLEQADEQLAKLRDWHDYTAGPKRVALIERMQSLVGAEIAPEQLAQHIRRLQAEWRTLHRGAGEDDSADAKRFRELGNQAYEPCRLHFAAQAAKRAENLAQRESILTRLAAYTEGLAAGTPNWRHVAQVLTEARNEWRVHAPVDQDKAAALQARFKAALEALGGQLDAEHARNVAARQQLIERAAALLALPDVRAAMDGAKALQRDWQGLGVVPRHKDNALWETFRGHCNAVFERATQESAARGAALGANATRAGELLAELERIGALEGDALREALKGTEALQAEFDALELPRASARELHMKFQRAVDRCHEATQADRARVAGRARSGIYDTAVAIRAYSAARAAGADEADVEALRTAAETAVAGLAGAPKPPRAALEKHWQRAQAGSVAADAAANEEALRLLCIRAELAADRPTPAEDHDRRRAYQMQRLLASRNLGADASGDDIEALALEWLGVGPLDEARERTLRERFEGTRQARAPRRR